MLITVDGDSVVGECSLSAAVDISEFMSNIGSWLDSVLAADVVMG